ncbi:sulfatase [Candidatus Bathyarchaeota archaeon]|nr:sulfatase [Candidatus Bathyarchaeota archaeon]
MSEKINWRILGVDSLRADHMSCYGYHRLTTPHMDKIAKEGVLFENAFSPHIPTTPGYTTMLSGMDVMSHQVVSLRHKAPIGLDIRLLPEILREKGYISALVGFDGKFYRGFDIYESYPSWSIDQDGYMRKAEHLNKKAIPLLESMAKKPFFLFLRHMDPHTPYLPPPPFERMFYGGNEKDPSKHSLEPVFAFKPFADYFKSWMPEGVTDAEYIIAQYDAALAYMDVCIQRIFTFLKELDLMDRTLIIITSDHGESLMEHECYFDHHGLYECTIHIPLILRLPDKLPKEKRIRGYVLQQDLVPTILELLGYKEELKNLKLDGKSTLPLIIGERVTNYTEFYLTECTWMRKRGWRTPEWKLICALEPDFHNKPSIELYNLVDDPEENNNLAKEESEIVKTLKNRMESWIRKRTSETGKPDPILEYYLGLDLKIGPIKKTRNVQDANDIKGMKIEEYMKTKA